jgi:hypothetical protein
MWEGEEGKKEEEDEGHWPTCGRQDCTGIQLPDQGFCLAHVEEAARAAFLAGLQPGSDLDLRGTPIDTDLLSALLRALQEDEKLRLGNAWFNRARFSGNVPFGGAQFSQDANFNEAHFDGDTDFQGAQFSGNVGFHAARFSGTATFGGAHFGRNALFIGAQFSGTAGFEGAQFSGEATFSRAQFSEYAAFNGVQFSGNAVFDLAKFSENAAFNRVQFSGNAVFDLAKFSEFAGFQEAQFSGEARFFGTQFSLDAWFQAARFSGSAVFDEAQFNRLAVFGTAYFSNVSFQEARFAWDASFIEAHFSGTAAFGRADFSGAANFDNAQLSAPRVLGPLIAKSELSLRQASFSAPVLIEVATPWLALSEVAFQEAATLRVRFAEIVLDATSFAKPSTISCAETAFETWIGTFQTRSLNDNALETGNRGARPRLVSLRLVDVSNLVLENLDLSACLFQGAHNLEKLRIEGPLRFGLTPGPWRIRVGPWWIPIWRPWLRRQTLAEEHHSRAQQSSSQPLEVEAVFRLQPGRGGEKGEEPMLGIARHGARVEQVGERFRAPRWNPPQVQTPDWLEVTTRQQVQILSQENLAALYRALRKGLEDQKNAPGAADFYYGEMEMRRHSPTSAWTDRFVLWVYWLFSGYGLRAIRALVAFALLVPLFAIGFWLWGLDPDHGQRVSYPIALLRSFESATSLLRPPPQGLTYIGQLVDAVLRLIGATLLGLALFSLRGRIKR